MTRLDLERKKIESFLTKGRPKLLRLALSCRGRPHVSSVWYIWRNGRIWISTAEDRLKVKVIRKNPRVSLVIDTDTQPYEGVIIEGTAHLTKSRVREITYDIVEKYSTKSEAKSVFESLMRAPRILIYIDPEKALDIMSYREH